MSPAAWARGAEVGHARPVELGVGHQAQKPGNPLGAKLGQVRIQVATLILPPGAQGDPQPARPDEFGFDPVDPQGHLGLDGVGDLVGE